LHEIAVGRVVGPEGEDAARMETGGAIAEVGGLVECGVLRVEKVFGRMIDVEEDGVEEARGSLGIEAGA
jgi:hypothetical protein